MEGAEGGMSCEEGVEERNNAGNMKAILEIYYTVYHVSHLVACVWGIK